MYFTSSDIKKRRTRVEHQWNNILDNNEVVLIHSGKLIQKPGGLDQCYPFIPHPTYFWLTGRRRDQEVLLYNKNIGWVEFQLQYTKQQLVWDGEAQDLLVAEPGKNIDDLKEFLLKENFELTYHLGQYEDTVQIEKHKHLKTALDQIRRIKDEAEINLIKEISRIAALGYGALKNALGPGITERELQIIYEGELYKNGAHKVPYETLIGSGKNASVLHAIPGKKVLSKNELVLVDAGADIYDYCVDVSRTYVTTKPTDSKRNNLYTLVLNVQKACIAACKPGIYWHEIHRLAAHKLTEGLLHLGILKSNYDALIEHELIGLFFPHGIGHLVGLKVRDTGHEENQHPKNYFGANLRVDVKLEQGMILTVEPGLYFIKPLIENALLEKNLHEFINIQELNNWMDIGGIRIEDNILITENGNENLTVNIEKSETLLV